MARFTAAFVRSSIYEYAGIYIYIYIYIYPIYMCIYIHIYIYKIKQFINLIDFSFKFCF